MTLVRLLLFALLGGGAGAGHFAALGRSVDVLVRGGPPLASIALLLGRVTLTGGVLALAALNGWPALLAAFAGFLAARQAMMRRAGEGR
ncbi:N-ATPase subunit AtpR [Hephaestia mangrovi]|uniref:N-ATPase subunit AtpR n=1 Tax=Hephaestia mangrovi TaxID=2873268 RepID=UPI001CA7687C|nr:ATP synthase subunit I [Hephaestia mangrovi]MBY8826538.1 ATP synthase subunit I [Hephaestia mangrovi]